MCINGTRLSGLKVLFVSSTDYSNRTREFREATTLCEAGADVHVIGYASRIPGIWKSSQVVVHEFTPVPCPEIASHHKCRYIRIFLNLSVNILRRGLRRFFVISNDHKKFIKAASSIKPDVVHAMDLPSLAEAKKIAQKCNAKLVYDSSEYWRGFLRNKVWSNNKRESSAYLASEKKNISAAELVITTSPTMSERLKKDYNFSAPVVALYNSPICRGKVPVARQIEGRLKVVFHGNIGPDRNLTGLLEALALTTSQISLDVYGNFVLGAQDECKKIVEEKHLRERVTFHGGFKYGDMLDFLVNYDIGFYPAYATDGNFDVTLPNKVFDCICAGLAIIVPPFESMKRLIAETGVGIIVDTTSPEEMARLLDRLNNNRDLVYKYKMRSCEIAQDYSWEAQGEKLIKVYSDAFVDKKESR